MRMLAPGSRYGCGSQEQSCSVWCRQRQGRLARDAHNALHILFAGLDITVTFKPKPTQKHPDGASDALTYPYIGFECCGRSRIYCSNASCCWEEVREYSGALPSVAQQRQCSSVKVNAHSHCSLEPATTYIEQLMNCEIVSHLLRTEVSSCRRLSLLSHQQRIAHETAFCAGTQPSLQHNRTRGHPLPCPPQTPTAPPSHPTHPTSPPSSLT